VSGGLDQRLAALDEAAGLARGRLDPAPVDAAEAVVRRAGQRLGLGVEATVVALAGPTGAGKSTLFNALAGAELSTPGVRRPTTSTATAAIWGADGDALLDWLQVGRRHRVGEGPLDGLVLLDLPDFDSVQEAHRLEVERVIGIADLVVWVVDPQKYADGAWHERYLRPLASYATTMEVVLNQADRLAPDARPALARDLTGLLHADGLDGVPVHAVSARTGLGLPELREAIARRVAARTAAAARLEADVRGAAQALAAGCERTARGRAEVRREDRARLGAALEEAAGVPTVVRAVDRAHRRRGALATGWPAVRWVRRLRPDPLRRLRLDTGDTAGGRGGDAARALPQGAGDAETAPAVRPSLPGPTGVQRAQVSTATRTLAAAAADGLGDPWPRRIREVAVAGEERAAEALSAAVGGTDLRRRSPAWWTAVGALQRGLAIVAVVGLLWLVVLAALGWLQLGDAVPTPDVEGLPVPTVLLVAGILGGLLVAFLARLAVGAGARRRARSAQRLLSERVAAVGDELIVAPVQDELAAREQLCAAAARAAAGSGGRRRLLGR
jgi:GTP-binding protein EngB required for normal cell division